MLIDAKCDLKQVDGLAYNKQHGCRSPELEMGRPAAEVPLARQLVMMRYRKVAALSLRSRCGPVSMPPVQK